ncbi:hypothetical protein Pmani_032237 [Petrolisthes manimaculis]|uniref:Uncharacterized protein n=1 Tax=Petrolisthes manimaculis TaxID=1843537 RepID=A0AAE1NTG2_9EUCA|nr:hypothetical protein Pmani_032237 [Petrolisthes manimaculis]
MSIDSVDGQNKAVLKGSVDGQNEITALSVGVQNKAVLSGTVGRKNKVPLRRIVVGENKTASSGSVDGGQTKFPLLVSVGGKSKILLRRSAPGQDAAPSRSSVFYKCGHCDKDFTRTNARKKHETKFHGVEHERVDEAKGGDHDPSLACTVCDKTFTRIDNKRAHERNQHGVKPQPRPITSGKDKRRPTSVKCKECNEAYRTLDNYREHLLHKHQIETHKTFHEFTSQKEFLAWKGSVEMEVGVNYTAHAGSWRTGEGSKQIFYCRRSGVKPATQDTCTSKKKRAQKKQGSSKLGLYCTSSMEVLRCDGTIRVTLYTDHHDHQLGPPHLVHMVLPKSEKDKIAGMITQGIERYKILEQVRKASGENRTSIVERKDIENIIAEYGLNESQSRHTDCQVCKCMYICSCDDNAAERKNPCKHIHTVVGYLKNNPRPRKRKSPKDSVCNEESTDTQAEEYREQLKWRMHLLLSKCDEMRDLESMKALDKYLSKAFGIVDVNDTNHSHSVNLPLDKNEGGKQDNPTKKKRRKEEEKSLRKPCVVEEAEQENGEIKCVKSHIDNEHSYTVSEFAII